MIDRSLFNVEDFLVDNTFQLYCAGTDELCIRYWESYIKAHPDQDGVINEAKRLYVILSGNKKSLAQHLPVFKEEIALPLAGKAFRIQRSYNWLKIAAAIVVLISITFLFTNRHEDAAPDRVMVSKFSTRAGERKRITLADGSVILLNAKSKLTLCNNFNRKKREVSLVGEAFFDITHNKNKPFKVHTADFDINVLGTAFNVKVYPGDATSEAVLIRGLIVMEGKGSKGSLITLKPSQKVTFFKKAVAEHVVKTAKPSVIHPEIAINRYTMVDDSVIVEMAWTQNRLEILDQEFSELKDVLERWYNVKITIKDKSIDEYRFTATFNKESIVEVLNALQKAEHFKYEIKGNQITISK